MFVSIHAPVWGATDILSCRRYNRTFQSTRPYGARRSLAGRVLLPCWFQSTRPYGARHVGIDDILPSEKFQSTRPYGARPNVKAITVATYLFQSTRPYGARRIIEFGNTSFIGFNPRARMGRDEERGHYAWRLFLFQSTRPYGARP